MALLCFTVEIYAVFTVLEALSWTFICTVQSNSRYSLTVHTSMYEKSSYIIMRQKAKDSSPFGQLIIFSRKLSFSYRYCMSIPPHFVTWE